jgi:hypothetical protein
MYATFKQKFISWRCANWLPILVNSVIRQGSSASRLLWFRVWIPPDGIHVCLRRADRSSRKVLSTAVCRFVCVCVFELENLKNEAVLPRVGLLRQRETQTDIKKSIDNVIPYNAGVDKSCVPRRPGH